MSLGLGPLTHFTRREKSKKPQISQAYHVLLYSPAYSFDNKCTVDGDFLTKIKQKCILITNNCIIPQSVCAFQRNMVTTGKTYDTQNQPNLINT